ncbi:U1 snRNP protein [Thecaphora frezii]
MPAPPPPPTWIEYRNPQGRPYWYHTIEKRSVWDKPPELKTPRERALDSTPWKEYKSGDRSYYVHSQTKQSTWTLPPEVKQILETYAGPDSAATPAPAVTPTPAARPAAPSTQPPALVGAGASASPTYPPMAMLPRGAGAADVAANASPGGPSARPGPRPTGPPPGYGTPGPSSSSSMPGRTPVGGGRHMSPDASASPNSTPGAAGVGAGASSTPGAPTPMPSSSSLPQRPPPSTNVRAEPVNFRGDKEAAEAAFISLLEEKRVDVDWTWEVTMRAIITEPLYKALKTISERKNAFAKYIDNLKRRRAEERAQRLEKLRPTFKDMVAQDGRIQSYHSFATVKKFCGGQAAWKEARDDDEARAVYEAVMKEMQETEAAQAREVRHRNMDMLMSLLKTFEADVLTRWRDAHRTVLESDEYAQDAHLRTMEVGDMLIVFDEHMKSIEKEASEQKQREAEAHRRKERKNRDEFRALLGEMRRSGELTARTPWSQVFARVKDDDRFLRVVGQAGSTPLELFYDAVDDLEQLVERQLDRVQAQLAWQGREVTGETTYDEFAAWLNEGEANANGAEATAETSEQQRAVYHQLRASYLERAAEERRRSERRRRHAIDDLRYALKKIDAAQLPLEASLDEIRPRIVHLAEYRELQADEEALQQAWEKHVRRQREKLGTTGGGGEGRRASAAWEEDEARKSRDPHSAAPSAGRGGAGAGAGGGGRARDTSVEADSAGGNAGTGRRYGHFSRRDRDRGDRAPSRGERSRDERERRLHHSPGRTGTRSAKREASSGQGAEPEAEGVEEVEEAARKRQRREREDDSEEEEGQV